MSNQDVRLLFINIFGGITRCDEIAGGVVMAYKEEEYSIPLVLRLEGTNKEKGLEIIRTLVVNYQLADDLVDGVEKISEIYSAGVKS